MKVQTIIKDQQDRSWDSIKEDEGQSLCRCLEHMKNFKEPGVVEVAKKAMFLLDTKNDYDSSISLLRASGYKVVIKFVGAC